MKQRNVRDQEKMKASGIYRELDGEKNSEKVFVIEGDEQHSDHRHRVTDKTWRQHDHH